MTTRRIQVFMHFTALTVRSLYLKHATRQG
jgi:hypothetical protein